MIKWSCYDQRNHILKTAVVVYSTLIRYRCHQSTPKSEHDPHCQVTCAVTWWSCDHTVLRAHTDTHAYMYSCTHTCTHTNTHTHTRTHTHTHTTHTHLLFHCTTGWLLWMKQVEYWILVRISYSPGYHFTTWPLTAIRPLQINFLFPVHRPHLFPVNTKNSIISVWMLVNTRYELVIE